MDSFQFLALLPGSRKLQDKQPGLLQESRGGTHLPQVSQHGPSTRQALDCNLDLQFSLWPGGPKITEKGPWMPSIGEVWEGRRQAGFLPWVTLHRRRAGCSSSEIHVRLERVGNKLSCLCCTAIRQRYSLQHGVFPTNAVSVKPSWAAER